MQNLLFKLMLLAALAQFGMSLGSLKLWDRGQMQTLEKHSRDVLRIDWKPISIFPEEAKRFR